MENKPHAHTTPHAVFTWSMWVMFSLTWDASSITDVTLNNTLCPTTFVRWLNVMSPRCYFSLSQLLGIRVAGSTQGAAATLLLLATSSFTLPEIHASAQYFFVVVLDSARHPHDDQHWVLNLRTFEKGLKCVWNALNWHPMIYTVV